jgi:hypothetical protein
MISTSTRSQHLPMSLSPLVAFWTPVPIVTSSMTSLGLKALVPYHLPQHRPQSMVFPGQSRPRSNVSSGIRLLSSAHLPKTMS